MTIVRSWALTAAEIRQKDVHILHIIASCSSYLAQTQLYGCYITAKLDINSLHPLIFNVSCKTRGCMSQASISTVTVALLSFCFLLLQSLITLSPFPLFLPLFLPFLCLLFCALHLSSCGQQLSITWCRWRCCLPCRWKISHSSADPHRGNKMNQHISCWLTDAHLSIYVYL